MKLPYTIRHFLRILLAAIFIYASLDKVWHPAMFAKAIYNYHLLPDMFLHPVAILLPWLELITGIMLLANVFPRTTAGVQFILLLIFTVAVISAVGRGLNIQCGCFNLDEYGTRTTLWKVGENLLLLILAGVVWLNTRSGKSLPVQSESE